MAMADVDELTAFLETAAMIASCDDYSLEDFLEACARAYCEVHDTKLVECEISARVEEKPKAN